MNKVVGAVAGLLVVIGALVPANPALSAGSSDGTQSVTASSWDWPK